MVYKQIAKNLFSTYKEIISLRQELDYIERKQDSNRVKKTIDLDGSGNLYSPIQSEILTKLNRFLENSHSFNEMGKNDVGYFDDIIDIPEMSEVSMAYLASMIESGVDISKISNPHNYNPLQLAALCSLITVGVDIKPYAYVGLSADRMLARATGEYYRVDLPSPELTIKEVKERGYVFDQEKYVPVSRENALMLSQNGFVIYNDYNLFPHKMLPLEPVEILAFLNEHSDKVYFLDKTQWDRVLAQRSKEQSEKILTMRKEENTQGKCCIYQLREDNEWSFERYDYVVEHGYDISEVRYDLIYVDEIGDMSLDDIYTKFNMDIPKDYYGHSLSVSDVVVLNIGNERKAYYVDSYGFKELPDFFLNKEIKKQHSYVDISNTSEDMVVVYGADVYVAIQESSEGGYDYTIYDKYKREIDGGIYDDDTISKNEALNYIIDDFITDKTEGFSVIPFADNFMEEVQQLENIKIQFAQKTQSMFREESVHMTLEELNREVKEYLEDRLQDTFVYTSLFGLELSEPILNGSLSRGIENENSDIDFIVPYKGDIKESELFNMLNSEEFIISGRKVDFNPIRPEESGTLEEYLLRADEYLEDKIANLGKNETSKNVRVSHLTGEPVSGEMLDILARCKNGELVEIEEIEGTKEIKTARSCVLHEIPTIERKDRESITEYALEKMLEFGSAIVDNDGNTRYNGSVKQGNRLDIVLGLPASGKSSTIVADLSRVYSSKMIDCDEAKKMLPEYNKGWGSNVVHKESQNIEIATFRASLKNNENIVLPKVGGNVKKILTEYIVPAKQAGYSVHIHYVELNRNVALGRMLGRFLDDGRFLDPNLINKYDNPMIGNTVNQTYEELKNNSMIDGYTKWDNNVEFGCEPILIEHVNSEFFLAKRHNDNDDSGGPNGGPNGGPYLSGKRR